MALQNASCFLPEDWSSWRWHMRNRVANVTKLEAWVNVTSPERDAIKACRGLYRWSITPYYASLMDENDSRCPIRQQAVPSTAELLPAPEGGDDIDPNEALKFQKTNRIIHRYPDRVLFLLTEACPVYCRHCQRKFHTTKSDSTFFESNEGESFERDFDYIRNTPKIRDIILSGGDPLSYPDNKLEYIIGSLRDISHVRTIRLGTRFPVLLPQRVTIDLCQMLEKYHPVWVNTHFNHPKEVTEESAIACDRLLRHGIPVGNQTVLLKGINDDAGVMRDLLYSLVDIRVRPYYIYHCINVTGVSHFRTSIETGRQIMEMLHGHVSGLAVPQYILGSEHGKISLSHKYVERLTDGRYRAISYEGNEFIFSDIDS